VPVIVVRYVVLLLGNDDVVVTVWFVR